MGKAGASRVERLIQTLWDAGSVGSLDDAELLRRFLRGDAAAEAAFGALVQRHAPMVLRVCRDVTGDPHDAQDVAQATFLILAQKAHSVRRHETLANWLFGTARRVAARASRDSVRRRRHERRYVETAAERRPSDPTSDGLDRDWSGLYQELDRLPERYRVPIVLCDLEGLTHEQAAIAMECPQRTLQTRLYRSRERLGRRLVRRGLMPAVGLMEGAFIAEARSVAITTAWADFTTHAATQLALGRAAAAVAPVAVTVLIQGMNRAMLLTRLKWTATFAVIAGLSAGLTHELARFTPGAGIQMPKGETGGDIPPTHRSPVGSGQTTKGGSAAKPPAEAAEPAQPAPLTTPITVSGRATNGEGKPVVGATIFLVSSNDTDPPLGTTTTDHDGSYTFREARLRVSQTREDIPSQGGFQIFGTAPGHGFAWHGMRAYQPRPRPAAWRVAGEDYTIFQGEPLVMDLRFLPAATLAGRVVDEAGRPVPGVRIRLIDCDYLDTEHKESHPNCREFWSIQSAPRVFTTSETDKDGHFRLEGLLQEAGYRVHVQHPDYARLSLYAATTARPTTAFEYPRQSIGFGQERPPVQTGELNVILRSTRRIAVRTVYADTGRPAPKVRVSASQKSAGASANGITDAAGKLLFCLPPGEYDLRADPTDGGATCIRTLSTLRVTDEPAEQPLEVRVNPGCILYLEVVDAKTGEGIPGVTFLSEADGKPGSRSSVQSRSGYIDNPRSDAKGQLRAVVEPGDWVYSLGYIPGSAGYGQISLEKQVSLPAGQTMTIRFELDK
ncbi:RNA polymerase sigma factor, sigma-70 family [Singulisphaera sp. GP187]|uniref:sigma-70 family RNA polymerase sigma factor n=1 Tax=Singulisphaera sp. GP187 TaxID=1882752 RepID=UPI00092AAC6F|nr:sigma-70 family RNA polymerase sigma factor [Singulisphaera sp. GP187]SIO58776.1 RNA polymerase sigma factor, sigma-70 family [Singulisphaera sp. GP187]